MLKEETIKRRQNQGVGEGAVTDQAGDLLQGVPDDLDILLFVLLLPAVRGGVASEFREK